MKFLPFSILLVPLIGLAQKKNEPTEDQVRAVYASLPRVDGNIEFTEVVHVDSAMSKDKLYRNAKSFLANEFKSAKDVIQYDDKAEGKMIAKGVVESSDYQSIFTAGVQEDRYVHFSLEIVCKDGRYKYRLHDLSLQIFRKSNSGEGRVNSTEDAWSFEDALAYCSKGSIKKMERRLFVDMVDKINGIIADLKKGMTAKSSDDF